MIYYVEDDINIRELALYALRQSGLEAQGFPDAGAFRQACADCPPDLVLLDIILPDANALDWGRRLKEDYGVNILYLSGLNTKEDVIRGLRAGGDDYMTKPYLIEELLLRVSSLMRRRDQEENLVRVILASVCGALTYVVLYMLKTFIYQRFVYGYPMDAVGATMVAKLVPSLINAAVAVVAAPVFYHALRPALRSAGMWEKLRA